MFNFTKKLDFAVYSFIIPSISVGNVAQLTCDLLISNFNLSKVGTVWHKAIIPVYGSNPFDSTDDNCVACELYASEEYKLVVLQIRSSIEPKMVKIFLNDLKQSILQEKFKQVLILTSSFAYEMHNFNVGLFRYISNVKNVQNILEEHKITELVATENIHGSGFASKLHELIKDSVETTVIIKYASEGDNRPDAITTLQLVAVCFIGLKQIEKINFPQSWDLVYGTPPPVGIY